MPCDPGRPKGSRTAAEFSPEAALTRRRPRGLIRRSFCSISSRHAARAKVASMKRRENSIQRTLSCKKYARGRAQTAACRDRPYPCNSTPDRNPRSAHATAFLWPRRRRISGFTVRNVVLHACSCSFLRRCTTHTVPRTRIGMEHQSSRCRSAAVVGRNGVATSGSVGTGAFSFANATASVEQLWRHAGS